MKNKSFQKYFLLSLILLTSVTFFDVKETLAIATPQVYACPVATGSGKFWRCTNSTDSLCALNADPCAGSCQLLVTIKCNSLVSAADITTTLKTYACKAGDGRYACGTDKNLSTVSSTNGECADKVKNSKEVDPSWCGKTTEEINASNTTSPTPVSGSVPGIQNNSGTKLFNPLPEEDLVHVFLLVTRGFLTTIGIVAAVFIIVGGIQMVTSAGNEEGITKAKKTITWAILGLVAALLSFSIIAIVQDFIGANISPAQQTTQTTK
jgi:hypothetical protein